MLEEHAEDRDSVEQVRKLRSATVGGGHWGKEGEGVKMTSARH